MTRALIVAATLISASANLANVAITAANAAASEEERKAVRAACSDDAKKLCAGVRPGQGRLINCMQAHAKELSPACRERFEQLQKAKS